MPPFWQGLEAHSLMSSSQRRPENPGLQSQLQTKESLILILRLQNRQLFCLLVAHVRKKNGSMKIN